MGGGGTRACLVPLDLSLRLAKEGGRHEEEVSKIIDGTSNPPPKTKRTIMVKVRVRYKNMEKNIKLGCAFVFVSNIIREQNSHLFRARVACVSNVFTWTDLYETLPKRPWTDLYENLPKRPFSLCACPPQCGGTQARRFIPRRLCCRARVVCGRWCRGYGIGVNTESIFGHSVWVGLVDIIVRFWAWCAWY